MGQSQNYNNSQLWGGSGLDGTQTSAKKVNCIFVTGSRSFPDINLIYISIKGFGKSDVVKSISRLPLAFLDMRMTSTAPREDEPRTQLAPIRGHPKNMLGVWDAENGFNGNSLSFANGVKTDPIVSITITVPSTIANGNVQIDHTGHGGGIMDSANINWWKGNVYFRSC